MMITLSITIIMIMLPTHDELGTCSTGAWWAYKHTHMVRIDRRKHRITFYALELDIAAVGVLCVIRAARKLPVGA